MIWTTEEFYDKVNNNYLLSLDENYKTGFKILGDESPEDEINNWISNVTNNKINQLYGTKTKTSVILSILCILRKQAFHGYNQFFFTSSLQINFLMILHCCSQMQSGSRIPGLSHSILFLKGNKYMV